MEDWVRIPLYTSPLILIGIESSYYSKRNVAGSSPVNGITPIVAQMVERLYPYSPPIILEHRVFLHAVKANDS